MLTFIFLVLVPVLVGSIAPYVQYPLFAFVAYRITRHASGNWRIRILLFAIACSVIAAAAFLIPEAMNLGIEQHADELRAGDKPFSGPALSGGTLAMISPRKYWENPKDGKPPRCDAYCRKFLFNGTFARVLMGNMERGLDAPIPRDGLVGYHIERREICPQFSVAQDNHQGDDGPFEENVSVKERMAAGECVIAEPASLDEADVSLVQKLSLDSERQWPSRANEQTGSKTAVYVSQRIEAYIQKNGSKELVARITPVTIITAKVPLLYGLSGGKEFNFSFGILYNTQRDENENIEKIYNIVFGDGMQPPAPGDHLKARARLEQALADTNAPANDPRLRMTSVVLDDIGKMPRKDDKDLPLLRSVITDRRLNWQDLSHLNYAMHGFSPASSRLLAETIIQELEAILVVKGPKRSFPTDQANALLHVLPTLPRQTIQGFSVRIYALLERSMSPDFADLPERDALFQSLTSDDEGVRKLAGVVADPDVLARVTRTGQGAGSYDRRSRRGLQVQALQALDRLPPESLEAMKPQLIEGLRNWRENAKYIDADGDTCSLSYRFGPNMEGSFRYLVTVLVRMGETETVKEILSSCPRGLANIPDAEAARTKKFQW